MLTLFEDVTKQNAKEILICFEDFAKHITKEMLRAFRILQSKMQRKC